MTIKCVVSERQAMRGSAWLLLCFREGAAQVGSSNNSRQLQRTSFHAQDPEPLIRPGLARLLAGQHQIEALLDLAERQRETRALIRGKTGHDLALFPQ